MNGDGESAAAAYARHVNDGLARLLSFMGLDAAAVRAEGCFVWDEQGRRFLDFLGGYGVFSFGHRHPRIVAAVTAQLERMPLSAKILFDKPTAELAARLADITPGSISKFFFCNSGTEAVEGALKLARLASGRSRIIYAENSFHGKTLGALSATGRDKYREPFLPLLPEFTGVPFGDATAMAKALDETVAAVILEPIQGEGGVIVPPLGYLAEVRELTRQRGALLILDEVQTGMGRTGYNFACEREGVEPDFILLAKALGGGVMPLGAIGGTPEVWAKFEQNPLIHSSTFGGNPLACAAGIAALDVLQEEQLAERAAQEGEPFLARLRKLAADYPDLVKETRGRGLIIGMEFVSSDVAELFVASLIAQQVLVAFTLNAPEVIRFEPPLNTPHQLFDEVAEKVATALAETKKLVSEFA